MNSDESKGSFLIFWIIWIALQSGVFVMYTVLGQSVAPSGNSQFWQAALVPVVIATFIRWVLLPRARGMQKGLTLFIVGMAMAESACVLGLVVFPAHRDELFLTGAIGIFQFIPIYARSLVDGDDP